MKIFAIQEDTYRDPKESVEVCQATRVPEKAEHLITPKEQLSLEDWMEEDREKGDIWETGNTITGCHPRFIVESLGTQDPEDLVLLEKEGDFILLGKTGKPKTFNRYHPNKKKVTP